MQLILRRKRSIIGKLKSWGRRGTLDLSTIKVQSITSSMISETITQRTDIVIRRHILEPGEALPWHTDLCHRFSVIIRGDMIDIEYRDTKEVKPVSVHPGLADWDAPQEKVHRAINTGKIPYEEVIIFFIEKADIEPQPEA